MSITTDHVPDSRHGHSQANIRTGGKQHNLGRPGRFNAAGFKSGDFADSLNYNGEQEKSNNLNSTLTKLQQIRSEMNSYYKEKNKHFDEKERENLKSRIS